MTKTQKPNNGLFIPLEILKREYNSKLLLCVEMVYRKMTVFIGHKSSVIKLAKLASYPGILFYKSAYGPGCEFFDDLQKKGFAIVAQDEEAGIIYDKFSTIYNRRLSLKNADKLDIFFCWGKDDFSYITQQTNDKNRIKLTGSPRTCFWGEHGKQYFKTTIKKIKKQYGSFILFVSNFASGNSYLSSEQTDAHLSQYPSWTENEKKINLKIKNFDNRMIQAFIAASQKISKGKKSSIIIRPHPTENVKKWEEITKNIPNVNVVAEGDITPWILAAKCIVQNGCTSAIEAACANVPTIAFGENESDLFSKHNTIPNLCSIPAVGIDNLINTLNNIQDIWDEAYNSRKELLNRKVYNAGSLQPVYDMADCLISISGPPNPNGNDNLGHDSFVYDIFELYRMSPLRRKTTGVIFDQAKRPTISHKKISNDSKEMMSVLGYDFDMDVRRVAPNCFRISKKY